MHSNSLYSAQYSAQYSSNAVYPKSKTLGFIANIRKNYFAGQPETKTTLHCATKYIMLLARNLNFCTFCLTLHYNWLAVGCSWAKLFLYIPPPKKMVLYSYILRFKKKVSHSETYRCLRRNGCLRSCLDIWLIVWTVQPLCSEARAEIRTRDGRSRGTDH